MSKEKQSMIEINKSSKPRQTNISLAGILGLNMSLENKIYTVTQFIPEKESRLLALACAESTLDLFEKEYPNDMRLREALEASVMFTRRGEDTSNLVAIKASRAATAAMNTTIGPASWAAWAVVHAVGSLEPARACWKAIDCAMAAVANDVVRQVKETDKQLNMIRGLLLDLDSRAIYRGKSKKHPKFV